VRDEIVSGNVILSVGKIPGADSGTGASAEIRLLGAPAVLCAGKSLAPESRKATALLAYLAMRADEPTSRDHLAGLLWGESADDQARANLRQALTQLRRLFRDAGVDPIETRGDQVTLSSAELSIDAFLLADAEALPDAARLPLDKEFMEGFTVPEPEFEQWLIAQRERLRARVCALHERAADEAIESHRVDKAIDHVTRALNLDPLQEHLHRRLMQLFAAQGRADAAVAQYERCRAVLMKELGVGPDRETKDLLGQIQALREGGEQPPPMVADRPSIAVLAFENMSSDPEQEYFSDGVVEDIITDLSKIPGLFVIARNSSFAYKGGQPDVREVCRELGVRYVLEGSVRKAAQRIRVTAQLIDGTTGGHLWAERYDRDLHDIFAVQDEVTREIVAALAPRLSPPEGEPADSSYTENLEAYEHFLRGRDQAFRDTPEANAQARAMLEKATELDPRFSLAFSHLSRNCVIAYVNRWGDEPDRSLERALKLGERAVELDETNPHAWFAIGAAALWSGQHDRAAAAADRCLALDPNFAEGHAVLGLILVYSGKPREAIASLHKAMRLDPHYRDIYLHLLALAHVQLEEYDQAASDLKRRLVRKPESDISRVLLASVHGHLGDVDASRAEWDEALRINPDYTLEHRRGILPYRNPADFEQILEGLRKGGLAKGAFPPAEA
jgi:TolB-like protein/Tfp pilus assembly protein PilF